MRRAWKAYAGALIETLGPQARQALREDLLGRAREVAREVVLPGKKR